MYPPQFPVRKWTVHDNVIGCHSYSSCICFAVLYFPPYSTAQTRSFLKLRNSWFVHYWADKQIGKIDQRIEEQTVSRHVESKNAYEIGNHHYRDPRAQRKTDTNSEEQFFAETFSRCWCWGSTEIVITRNKPYKQMKAFWASGLLVRCSRRNVRRKVNLHAVKITSHHCSH